MFYSTKKQTSPSSPMKTRIMSDITNLHLKPMSHPTKVQRTILEIQELQDIVLMNILEKPLIGNYVAAKGSQYQNGYEFTLIFTKEYPRAPPKIKCQSGNFHHPN
jgi:ubiquitin-protein ligase